MRSDSRSHNQASRRSALDPSIGVRGHRAVCTILFAAQTSAKRLWGEREGFHFVSYRHARLRGYSGVAGDSKEKKDGLQMEANVVDA